MEKYTSSFAGSGEIEVNPYGSHVSIMTEQIE